jgi:AcrR family transcriptional regulator
MGRSYQQTKRAEQQDETRTRIIEATIALHGEIGGPATTVSAIAARAGVERATVYRHFPDERAILQACTGHYIARNPPPAPDAWLKIAGAEERLTVALTEIYAYHRRTETISARAVIDVPQMPVLAELLRPMFAYWEGMRDLLAAPWLADGVAKPLLVGAIGHAIVFTTWQCLVRSQKLSDAEAVLVMTKMVRCVGEMRN